MTGHPKRHLARGMATLAALALSAGCGTASESTATATESDAPAPAAEEVVRIAYLPFSTANSYEKAILDAATAAAEEGNAEITVLSAENDPTQQYAQLQTAISSGQYDGILVQPILSTGLTPLVEQAIGQGIEVVTVDQLMGPDLTSSDIQVEGLSGSVAFNPSTLGEKIGAQVVDACTAGGMDPCQVGYLYDIKASSLDTAVNAAFTEAIAAGTNVEVVTEGEGFYTPSTALAAAQDMLQAEPELDLIVGSDQSIQGSVQAVEGAGRTGEVVLVGYGGSELGIAAVAAGDWFGTVVQLPATEGRTATEILIDAVRNATTSPGVDPIADAPNGGLVTQETADQFTGEWPG